MAGHDLIATKIKYISEFSVNELAVETGRNHKQISQGTWTIASVFERHYAAQRHATLDFM